MLRFGHPGGVRQAIYAYLITHHAVRQLMTHAAETAGADPNWSKRQPIEGR